jgi:hypothetical protein
MNDNCLSFIALEPEWSERSEAMEANATLRAECSFVAIELKHYIDTRRNTR